MKISQDLILGIAIGAGVAYLLANQSEPAPVVMKPQVPTKYKPFPSSPAQGPAQSINVPRRIGVRPWQTAWSSAYALHA